MSGKPIGEAPGRRNDLQEAVKSLGGTLACPLALHQAQVGHPGMDAQSFVDTGSTAKVADWLGILDSMKARVRFWMGMHG